MIRPIPLLREDMVMRLFRQPWVLGPPLIPHPHPTRHPSTETSTHPTKAPITRHRLRQSLPLRIPSTSTLATEDPNPAPPPAPIVEPTELTLPPAHITYHLRVMSSTTTLHRRPHMSRCSPASSSCPLLSSRRPIPDTPKCTVSLSGLSSPCSRRMSLHTPAPFQILIPTDLAAAYATRRVHATAACAAREEVSQNVTIEKFNFVSMMN